jgi:hypothetical protein
MPEDVLGTRRSVKRYYGVDAATGETNTDVWLDIEQVEELNIQWGQGKGFQRLMATYDPDADRAAEILRIYDPHDQSVYVPIPVAGRIGIKYGAGLTFQRNFLTIDNSAGNEVRETRVHRVYHRDVAESDINSPEARTEVIVTPDMTDAQFDAAGADRSQYVDSEVVISYGFKMGIGSNFQRRYLRLNTDGISGVHRPIERNDYDTAWRGRDG